MRIIEGETILDNQERVSLFVKIREKYRDNRESWNFKIGIFSTVLGIVISILTVIYSPNNWIVATSVVCCQFIVLVMCCITYGTFHKNKELLEETMKDCNSEIEKAHSASEAIKESFNLNVEFFEKHLIYQKNTNKRINNFLTIICDETDRYFYDVSNIQDKLNAKKEDPEFAELCKQQLDQARQRYKKSLYTLFNRYTRGVVDETLKIIMHYLTTKNIFLNASISIKLFESTYHNGTEYSSMRIYTAFRDKETYDKKEREIGEQHYSIDLNGDFLKCLSKECYIKNNITDSMDDYLNQNFPNSLRHYNCTVVVPIICDYKSDRQIFGFLCCDALNETYNCDIFDKNSANILYATALTLGTFFDGMNSAWSYVMDKELPDFLTYLHSETYRGV